jgi:hypothetical protein
MLLRDFRRRPTQGVVERSEDPPFAAVFWWVFAALDHTLRQRLFANLLESRNYF